MKKKDESMNTDTENIFTKGIENLRYLRGKENLGILLSLKIMAFYFLLCTISKYQTVDSDIFVINGAAEAKKGRGINEKYMRVYLRRFSDVGKQLIDFPSIVSSMKHIKRFRIICKAIITNSYGISNLGRWIEYRLLETFITGGGLSGVASFGHYDEVTVWITELCHKEHIKYVMYQHGVVIDQVQVPNKIYCDEAHVYNEFSKEVFQKRIIWNDDCTYFVDGFVSDIQFKHITKNKRKKYIGIIDQTFQDWVLEVIEQVTSLEDCIAVLLLHPLTRSSQYGLVGSEKLIITKLKYDNLDLLITHNSTMVLDYLCKGYQNPIICTDDAMEKGFYRDLDITYVSRNELCKKIQDFCGI